MCKIKKQTEANRQKANEEDKWNEEKKRFASRILAWFLTFFDDHNHDSDKCIRSTAGTGHGSSCFRGCVIG